MKYRHFRDGAIARRTSQQKTIFTETGGGFAAGELRELMAAATN
jgi:hypothetical protein